MTEIEEEKKKENEIKSNNETNSSSNQNEEQKNNQQSNNINSSDLSNQNNIIEIPENSPSDSIKILKKGSESSTLNISYDFLFKVSLIGDSATGKTSIITRFIDDVFKEETSTTIGVDFKIVSLDLGENTYAKMQIWDTCGSERFKSITASFLKSCSAFILVFDLNRKNTFKSIENWIKTINENTKPKFLILIGNKCDLKRDVNKDEIILFCEKNKLNYIEISVKENKNVEKIFKEVAYQLYKDIKIKKSENKNVNLQEFEIGGFKNIKIEDEKNENEIKKKSNKCC
jgi:small GTP-binding protein